MGGEGVCCIMLTVLLYYINQNVLLVHICVCVCARARTHVSVSVLLGHEFDMVGILVLLSRLPMLLAHLILSCHASGYAGAHKMHALPVQTSPFLTHTLFACLCSCLT